jgi:hypothetical protein
MTLVTPLPAYLTPVEVAELLNVSVKTVLRWSLLAITKERGIRDRPAASRRLPAAGELR